MRPLAFTLALALALAASRAPQAGAATPLTADELRLWTPGGPLPGTGLFAPVKEQLLTRMVQLERLPGTNVTPERLTLLLETGQMDEAARLALGLRPTELRGVVARIRVALAVQDFAGAERFVETAAAFLDDDSRAVRYRWESVRDAAAVIDSLTRARLATDPVAVPELLAAGRLAYDQLDYARADSLFARALAAAPERPGVATVQQHRSTAHLGRALVMQKRRDWDGSLAELTLALAENATPDALEALANTLIRLGRTDEAIVAARWGVRLNPYHDPSHYLLGNGYTRRNYTQLLAEMPNRFADAAGRKRLAAADAQLAAGGRDAARAAYGRETGAHPRWADAHVRLASLDFEDGRFAEARAGCFRAIAICPEYGRAHAVLAKVLESERFVVDVHRAEYERRFAAAATPRVPGIERFVLNWRSLSLRHQKRVALSVAPWRAFIPVLVDGGATFYVKPVYMRLSECPEMETLKDQRINYDSRLWDDVRGAGGFHTVTGIEDVERTIFDRYDTVLHELTHQVHGVLPADDSRVIQEHYRRAKALDDSTRNGFLSRYAGGSVYEYFAEGANALGSPKRDAYDPREVVKERLEPMDPPLATLVRGLFARTDVKASYPVAYAAGGDDRVSRGKVAEALPFYRKALSAKPDEETALISYANALVLGGQAAKAESIATRAVKAHPTSGPARLALAEARWCTGRGLANVRTDLAAERSSVRAEDHYQIDQALGGYAWSAGDAAASLAAYDSVIAYQSDNPAGLHGRASALALAGRFDEAFPIYDAAVRMRTGNVELRCDLARDLLFAKRTADAKRQLDEAALLDVENPTAEALRAWAALAEGDTAAARNHVRQALAWGPWCDIARIVEGAVALGAGNRAAATKAWAPVRDRIAKGTPPSFVFRPKLATWERVHALPEVERRLLERFSMQ